MDKIFQIEAYINKISTMATGLRMQIDTQDNLSPDAISRLFNLRDKLGWLTFNVSEIQPEDIMDLPPLVDKEQKSQAVRLRGSLFRLWEMQPEGYKDSELHYRYYTEKFITMTKDKMKQLED